MLGAVLLQRLFLLYQSIKKFTINEEPSLVL